MSEHGAWTMVVAVAQNGIIGRMGTLPWKLSSDLRRFKSMTMGQCLLMGRKTYESIGRPLPGRQTIVLSCTGLASAPSDVSVLSALERVDASVQPGRRVMVVGGAQLYAAALPYCETIWLTRVLADVPGDTRLMDIDWQAWRLESSEPTPAGPKDDWPTDFQIWQRIAPMPILAATRIEPAQ